MSKKKMKQAEIRKHRKREKLVRHYLDCFERSEEYNMRQIEESEMVQTIEDNEGMNLIVKAQIWNLIKILLDGEMTIKDFLESQDDQIIEFRASLAMNYFMCLSEVMNISQADWLKSLMATHQGGSDLDWLEKADLIDRSDGKVKVKMPDIRRTEVTDIEQEFLNKEV